LFGNLREEPCEARGQRNLGERREATPFVRPPGDQEAAAMPPDLVERVQHVLRAIGVVAGMDDSLRRVRAHDEGGSREEARLLAKRRRARELHRLPPRELRDAASYLRRAKG